MRHKLQILQNFPFSYATRRLTFHFLKFLPFSVHSDPIYTYMHSIMSHFNSTLSNIPTPVFVSCLPPSFLFPTTGYPV